MSFDQINVFDSHTHIVSTGQVLLSLQLSQITSLSQLNADQDQFETISGWVIGFGWDESQIREGRPWTRFELDQIFPSVPVYLSRCDGHAGVINTCGIDWLVTKGSSMNIFSDQVIKDKNHFKILSLLPQPSLEDRMRFIKSASRLFNKGGYSHIRDMDGAREAFQAACLLEKRGELTLHIDWNFQCSNLNELYRVLSTVELLKKHETILNKVEGVKFFLDGTLGSKTALLSKAYDDDSDKTNFGQSYWSHDDIYELIKETWRRGFSVACHTIGDEAVDKIVRIAREVSTNGESGTLNLEHAQVIREETIQKMKSLHLRCHLQPAHWLTDKVWLKSRLGSLYKHVFPWEALRRARIPMYFGSDSPISPPSVNAILKALSESPLSGVPKLMSSPWNYMCREQAPNVAKGLTQFEGTQVCLVKLNDQIIYKNDSLF